MPDGQLLAIHDALEPLENTEPITARMVTIRFSAELTLDAFASAVSVSVSAVSKYGAIARTSHLQILDVEPISARDFWTCEFRFRVKNGH